MKKTTLPHVQAKTVKGTTYYYFRRGKVYIRLKGDPDSKEFHDQYWAIRSGKHKPTLKTTWDALIVSYYSSPKFKNLGEGTRANYRRHCEAIREKNGPKDVRTFRRAHALASRDALADTWSKANERVAVLSILMKHAVDLEWIERNPVVDIEKLKGGEYEAWPDSKLRAYERAADVGTVPRTVYELAVGTGQRLGDCIGMTWADFDGEYMAVVQDKTKAKLWIYCPARLRSYLANLPKQGKHILARNLSQSMGKRAVQKAVEDVREAIGVKSGPGRLVIHGWRYTAARELAEAGCTDAQIQAVTGHKTLAMVQKYRAQTDQKQASKSAQMRREQNENET